MNDQALTTVRGIVVPDEWDPGGDVDGVAIVTYSEEKIPVVINAMSRKLLPMMHKRVIVKGILHEYGGSVAIEVTEITIDDAPLPEKSPLGFLSTAK
jgi:hypothetical protein